MRAPGLILALILLGAAGPSAIVDASRALFGLGLADPRGGEYREMEVVIGNVWTGGPNIARTHGWVLPAAPGRNPEAVGWNGVVYVQVSVGKKVNLRADVKAAIGARRKPSSGRGRPWSLRDETWEGGLLSFERPHPLWVPLLLRLGEERLAIDVWTLLLEEMPPATNDNDLHRADPFLLFAGDLAWSLFDRAVTAHMRGDPMLASNTASRLAGLLPGLEAEATRRGFPRNQFAFLEGGLGAFVDEARRRVLPPSSPPPPMPPVGPTAPSGCSSMISIRSRCGQNGQPGSVSIRGDLAVRAVVAHGAAAVGPLSNCVEHDRRLTRTVAFGRDFRRSRTIISVSQACREGLAEIAETNEKR